MLTFSRKSALLASAVADAEAMSPRACNNNQQLNIFNSFSLCDLVQCGHLMIQRGSVEWLSLECPRMGYKVLRWDTNPWDTIQSRTYPKSKPINPLASHTTASSGEKASLSARHFFFRGNYYRKMRARSHCVLAVNFAYLDASLFGNRSGKEGIYLRTTFNLGENGRKRRL